MKKVIITLLVLALLGGGGYAAYYYFYGSTQHSQTRVSSDSEDAVYVETVSSITGYGSGSGVVERFSGEVEAQATLEIQLDSDRTLDECYVEEGDIVEEGQKLFSYDTQDDEDQITQDEIDIEKNEMDIESYETQITQQEKLMNSATDEDDKTEAYLEILSYQNTIRQLEYEIETKENEIASLQASIKNSVVTAEMGGIIQKINDPSTESESYSTSDSSAYITILAEGDYRIRGTVNELNIGNIYEGMDMIVYSRVDSSLTWNGTITEISTEQDEDDDDYYYSYSSSDTSTYSFYVELDSSEGLLLGQHVYMEEDAGQAEEKSGLWLEEFYIMIEDDGAYVWLANTSNVIEKHEITLGEYDEDLCEYEILDGLEADDYIAYPLNTISEGDPVYYFDIAAVNEAGDSDDDDSDYVDGDFDSDEDLDDMYYDADSGEYYVMDDDDEYYDEDDEYYDEDDEYYDEYYDEDDEYYDDEYYDEDDEYDDDDAVYYDE
ncbi:MAG: efflux RND transporter periplasmic adaptor subunit [Lachnospiraceae bacterium]|nr:efflux RND transporter periplasmic adaptor subunit [Lachnospiraceae bacterium]